MLRVILNRLVSTVTHLGAKFPDIPLPNDFLATY